MSKLSQQLYGRMSEKDKALDDQLFEEKKLVVRTLPEDWRNAWTFPEFRKKEEKKDEQSDDTNK